MNERASDDDGRRFDAALGRCADEIERRLDALLASAPAAGESERPARLLAAIRHGALGGGKRLRPFLLVETARLFGAANEAAWRAASALELVHCYSLVHDDLPAMDDDDLRRGRPTVHKAFDEATAILAGDALLTLAFDVIAEPQAGVEAATMLALTRGLARAAGLGGMAGGQALDLEAEARATPLQAEAVTRLQAMKTGALLAFAIEAGARIGGANAVESEALARYGGALGACFQIADDILDAESDAATLGKRAGKDADRNKATLVSALGLEAARARRDALADEALAALDALSGRDAAILRETARFVAARDR
ncbi:MAG: polyprenyl synthetase family protein [Methylobacteriaceae bacterium]|nr:polyprenyl synthetase family protein [Methylobacteriaceae bacterium]